MDAGQLEIKFETEAGTGWFKYDKNTGIFSFGIEHTGAELSPEQLDQFLKWVGVTSQPEE